MTIDQSFIEQNRTSTHRIRTLIAMLDDNELQKPVGQHWTIAITLAHLAFWDRRVIYLLNMTEREGKLVASEIDVVVNDISLPFLAAIPPRKAALLSLENAEELDARLESYPLQLLEEIYVYYQRWVLRFLHRNEHLDEIEAVLTNSNHRPRPFAGDSTRSE